MTIQHTFKEHPSKTFTIADHVQCTNCEAKGLVTRGREDCPNCKSIGSLAWVDPDNPEVEI
jgi:DnaJ-class molecular chaperone